MTDEGFAFTVAFCVLLGTPIIAPVSALRMRRLGLKIQRRLFSIMAGIVLLVPIAALLSVTTTSYKINVAAVAAASVSVGIMGMSAFRLRRRVVGLTVGATACFVLFVGLLLGSVGALAVLFVVGDTVPVYEGSLPGNRTCRVIKFGNATTPVGGYEVVIKTKLPFLPFLDAWPVLRRYDYADFQPAEACKRGLVEGRG